MSLNTKAFAAQDALVEALQADERLVDWRIDYGLPPVRPEELHIWVDDRIDNWGQESPTTGVVTRRESFNVEVYIYGRRTDATAKEVRDEIYGAAGVVADTVGSQPFLGGAVLYAEITALEYDAAFADPEGRQREGVLKVSVTCLAHLVAV